MKTSINQLIPATLSWMALTLWVPIQASAFTYQGRLTDNGSPYTGSAEFQFVLWDSAESGAPVATNDPVQVVLPINNGLFTVELDFSNEIFDEQELFLEIEVRTSIGAFTRLSPRQPITPTPYAIRAAKATAAMTMDVGIIRNPEFLGTTTDMPLELSVNNQRVLRLEDNGDSNDPDEEPDGAPNIVGGSPVNVAGAATVGATISGGGAANYFGISFPNSVLANFGTIGGGFGNQIESLEATIGGGSLHQIRPDATASTIGGGENNSVGTNSFRSTIAGGGNNAIENDADHSVIGGGYNNNIGTESRSATIAGGVANEVGGDSREAVIGGGTGNEVGDFSYATVIAGGDRNFIGNSSHYATISGGQLNYLGAGSQYSVIAGGRDNTIGGSADYAFAAGRRARANHNGAFVWGDGTDVDTASNGVNTWTTRASGGYYLYSNSGSIVLGVRLSAGGSSWSSISDRNAKENFQRVDTSLILERLAEMPLSRWNYKGDAEQREYVGPTAQDFHAAFDLGDETHINTLDADGVAFAAIQGLHQLVQEREAEIQEMKSELAEIKAALQQLAGATEHASN